MKKVLFTLLITLACLWAWADNSVTVTYNGNTATVTVDDNVAQYLTVTQSGAHVSITQSSAVAEEITYTLTGTSTNGEFYMAGSYKATIELNGLTLTNSTPVYSGAAVHIQNGKRINVKVVTGTTNTLTDAASGSQKGCLYVKGHAEFKQYGTLNVVGNASHGIKAGEYISVKNATINVTSAVDDGISCNQYFLMESGSISISGAGDDGIQCDIDGDTSTGMTIDHENEDSGNLYVSGGSITINSNAIAAKGIKCQGDAYISGTAVINVTTTGKGEWDTTDQETNSACGLSADGDINISGGTITLTATGSGGKGMKSDNVINISGGDITVSTTGALYYNNGSTENTNYTGNTDQISSNYYSAAKGIKAGYKNESGTICYGGINISGGTIYVTTKGRNAEGIESKNYLNVTGGETTIDAYDDGINAAEDLYITDGYFYSRSSNNDGIDANGNVVIEGGLIYAIGAAAPEVAIDANSEENKKFHFNGGVLITIGGLESGSTLEQACYQSSSVSSNTWYSMTYGGNVIAFLTPTVSSGSGGGPGGGPGGGGSSGLVISAPSTPTLKSGVTVSNGTPVFYGPKAYLDATVTGGSSVSLSQYTSGGGGSSGYYTVTATANPTAGGTVTGANTYSAHSLCTLIATANAGYTFVNWTRNGSVASTDPTYKFYVTENSTCVANFTQSLPSYTVTATANPTNGGHVTGAGSYTQGTTATLTATANSGYGFTNWTSNGTQVSTDNPYTFTVTGDATFVANFTALQQHTVTCNTTQNGSISASPTSAYMGDVITLTATPASGYCLESWTVKDASNNTITVTNNLFTMPDSNVTVSATFAQGMQITLAPVTNGSISADPLCALQGMTINLTATPANGYEFGNWLVYKTGDTNTTITVNGNSFTMPNYPVTVSATFVLGPTELTVYDGTATNGYIPMYGWYFDDYTKSECIIPASQLTSITGCTITAITFYPSSVGTRNWGESTQTVFLKEVSGTTLGGSYSGTSGATTVKVASPLEMPVAGSPYTITFDTPYEYNGGNLLIGVYNTDDGDYNKVEWYGTSNLTSGVSAYGTNYSSLNSVTYNAQSFLPKTTFTYMPASNDPVAIAVNANPAEGGTVTGAGIYDLGTTATLTATANEGYTFTNWTKNGVAVSTNANYSFTVNAASAGTYVANFTINSYTVTATANPAEGGTVTVGTRNRDDLVYDFEDGWQGWTTFQGNTTSPNSWMHNTSYPTSNNNFSTGYGHNSSDGFMLSESYISGSTSGTGTAVTPDNYLVSPQVRLGGSISFYAGARNTQYCAEKFSVMVSTTDNTNAASFTTVGTWTLSLSSAGYTTSPYTVDLSAYSGMGYVAIRHYDCNNQWFLCVDDITIVEGEDESSASGNFNYGETCLVTATPNTGYYFAGWTENGTLVSTSVSYSFTVTSDRDLEANFTEEMPSQTVPLSAGTNWFSTYLDITLEDLQNALNAALPEATSMTIKSKNGNCRWNGSIWRAGNTFVWDVAKMYMIEVPEDCEIILTGLPIIPAEHPITIEANTSTWIGFPFIQSKTLDEAIPSGFAVTGDVIKSKDGNARYTGTGWRASGFDSLEPNKGYMYVPASTVTEDRTLIFSASKK